MCRPDYYGVKYEINPWMKIDRAANLLRSSVQWQTLNHTLIRLGALIEYVTPDPKQPDMVFTANAGLVRGKKAVLAAFRYKERQGEEKGYRAWFEAAGYEVVTISKGNFEGEGDALFAADTLFCGYGFRSDKEAYLEIAKALAVPKTVMCELIDPRFYHLDTCFCPITAKSAILFEGAFTKESLKRMSAEIELIPVPEHEALRFACNAVVLGKDLVLPSGCDDTMKVLKSRGFITHPVELDEFLKAGGAAKCLTLKLINGTN
jgi:N-dimethylarginine dimethylaminohydrolase